MNGDGMSMRQGGPGGRRPRGRHHSSGPGTGNNGGGGGGRPQRSAASLRHQTFDSNGPDVRVRGNAWQVFEKYQSLARDAQGAGDHVLAESYLQHAEHYYRVTEAINEATSFEQQKRGGQPFGDQQPDVPTNYYAPDGQLLDQQNYNPQTQQRPQPESQPPMQEAEISRRSPPPRAPDPFFAKDDDGEDTDSGPQKLVVGH